MPPAPRRSEGRRTLIGVVVFVVVLLVVNSWVASRIEQPEQRVRVPYSPVFLDQVHAGNVKSVSSRASTVQGTFRRALGYPPRAPKAKPSHLFVTEVPTFANTDDLFRLLRAKGVVVNAKPADQGPSWFESLLSALLPTLLIVAADGVAAAAPSGASAGGRSVGSGARARGASSRPAERVTFDDVAGIDEAKAELTEIVDFLREPGEVPPARRPDPARGAADRTAGRGQDAAGARARR